LVDEQTREDLTFQLSKYRYFLDKVVEMRTSMISQKNVGKLLQKVNEVCTRYMQRFSDEED